jgi:hypothetical protein
MDSTRPRMIAVAVTVCLFAVGMAAFLNYFKYRSTADRIVKARLVVIGKSIENSIQASLALGLSFADLGMLQGLMERETATHDLVGGIDVFDTEGKPLYSTDRLRAGRTVPEPWLVAARRASDADWFVEQGNESAVGISIKNNFGLTVGYLALRYSREKIDAAAHAVGRELMLTALAVFVGAAGLASIALVLVMRRLERDMSTVEAVLQNPDRIGASEVISKGIFGPAFVRFFDTARAAEAHIAVARSKLSRGGDR